MLRIQILIIVLSPGLLVAQQTDTLSLETIFHEPYLPGVRPDFVSFSPDEHRIYFSWNDSALSEQKHYTADINGGDLREYEDDIFTRARLSPDGRLIAYTREGDLWIAGRDAEKPRVLVSSIPSAHSPVWSPDSRSLAFIRDGDVWLTGVHQPELRQLTGKGEDDPGYTIRDWTADGTYLILTEFDTSDYREIYFPEYADTFVVPGMTRRGQAEVTVSALHVDSLSIDSLVHGVYFINEVAVNHRGNLVAVDRMDRYLKTREITIFDLESDTRSIVFRDSTGGWIYPMLSYMDFAPESDRLFFTSEQDGWNHIYTVMPDASNPEQHTSGEYEIPWAEWLDDQNIVFASTEPDPGERQIGILNISDGKVDRITQTEAYRLHFNLSPEKRYLVYQKTFWNTPGDLHLLDLDNPDGEVQLTRSVPKQFGSIDWQTPEYIRFVSRDGETPLSMRVLKPEGFEPDKKYPVVVFAHGAGSLQNVYKGWSENYWREYMFDQFLTRQGFVVVEVDFRHSTGYGRAFREDVTNWMGHFETRDIIDGLDYLEENGGYLDLDRVGIYGGSYGGFMALYAVSVAPERFHAAAALRKVTNWVNYYHANPWYTGPRLGHPEKHPVHYEKSSPLSYADSLTRPVLLLHGLIDDNVGFQDAMQYVDRLLKSGNHNFEIMVYPTERHAFQDPNSWYDEYLRIFRFFRKHLHPAGPEPDADPAEAGL